MEVKKYRPEPLVICKAFILLGFVIQVHSQPTLSCLPNTANLTCGTFVNCTCINEDDEASRTTVWTGSVITPGSCLGATPDQVLLPHFPFNTSMNVTCNNGRVVGRPLSSNASFFESSLTLTVSSSDNGRTVICTLNGRDQPESIITLQVGVSPPINNGSLTIPSTSVTANTFTLTWDTVNGASSYVIQISDSSGGFCGESNSSVTVTENMRTFNNWTAIGQRCSFTVSTVLSDFCSASDPSENVSVILLEGSAPFNVSRPGGMRSNTLRVIFTAPRDSISCDVNYGLGGDCQNLNLSNFGSSTNSDVVNVDLSLDTDGVYCYRVNCTTVGSIETANVSSFTISRTFTYNSTTSVEPPVTSDSGIPFWVWIIIIVIIVISAIIVIPISGVVWKKNRDKHPPTSSDVEQQDGGKKNKKEKKFKKESGGQSDDNGDDRGLLHSGGGVQAAVMDTTPQMDSKLYSDPSAIKHEEAPTGEMYAMVDVSNKKKQVHHEEAATGDLYAMPDKKQKGGTLVDAPMYSSVDKKPPQVIYTDVQTVSTGQAQDRQKTDVVYSGVRL